MTRLIVTLFLLFGTLAGCSVFTKEAKPEVKEKTAEHNRNTQSKTQENNDNQKSGAQEEKVSDQSPLKEMRPQIGVKKIFVDKENLPTLTEEMVFAEGDYVQSIITIGQSASVVIYKWTDQEISIVKTLNNPDNPRKNYLNSLDGESSPEVMISEDDSTEPGWRVIRSNETVQTPYQTFTNVVVLQKTTNEVEGEETIYTHYLAPGIGLIKEVFELTGEQGYTEESVLQKVEE